MPTAIESANNSDPSQSPRHNAKNKKIAKENKMIIFDKKIPKSLIPF